MQFWHASGVYHQQSKFVVMALSSFAWPVLACCMMRGKQQLGCCCNRLLSIVGAGKLIGGEWRVGVGHHLPPTNESGTSNTSPCSHLQPSQTIHPPLVPVAPYLGHSADPSSLRNPTDSHPCLPGVVTVKNPPKKKLLRGAVGVILVGTTMAFTSISRHVTPL